jgi:dienelactone hydrolase
MRCQASFSGAKKFSRKPGGRIGRHTIMYSPRPLFLILLAGLALAPGAGARPPVDDGAVRSPAALWQGYDPEALPLEVERLRAWEEEGCALAAVRFTGEAVDGGKTRVFAFQGAPVGSPRGLAGILHIHGGGQTASAAWVKFWAKRGYACVSFDFCGPWEGRTEFTDWGSVAHANMAQAAGGFQVHPTPRASSWFHWAVAARRALTLLARHPAVDPARLGIFGISVGGNLTWLVAGSDRRVKAAVPIYGSGYNHDDRFADWGFGPLSPDLRLFKQTLSPEAHAPYVTCPVLHLDATNDHHAKLDASDEILGAVAAPTRQAFTPRYVHHVEPEQGADLPRWMDWHLRGGAPFPASPEVRLALDDTGVPVATVRVPEGVPRRVEVFYSLGERWPPARYWRSAGAQRRGDRWEAALPVVEAWEPLLAFANVHDEGGICLSSRLARAIPGQLGRARATLAASMELAQGRGGLEPWFFVPAYTDPNLTATYLRVGQDETGPYLTFDPVLFGDPLRFNIATHLPGDPQFTGPAGAALSFMARGDFGAEGLTVRITEAEWTPRARTYRARAPAPGTGWRTVTLALADFADAGGQHPAGWTAVQRLQVEGAAPRADPPRFRGFRWEKAPR